MNKTNKMIYLAIIIIIFFALSLILLINDLINLLIVSVTITLVLLSYLIFIIVKKDEEESDYEKKLKLILKTYDSMLVYCEDKYELNNEQIIFVKRLEDMIKASEELNLPIAYIKEEHSSIFLLKEQKEVLTYVMKEDENVSSDFEKILIEYQETLKKENVSEQRLLDDIDKTMLIKLKNNKVFKVSPIKNKK